MHTRSPGWYAVAVPAHPPRTNPDLTSIDRVRQARVRPARDLTLGADIDRAMRDLKKQRRALGGSAAAWNAVIPPELVNKTSLETLSSGVLTVSVPDAATRFVLDRFLRAGGERQVIGASGAAIRKIRIVVG